MISLLMPKRRSTLPALALACALGAACATAPAPAPQPTTPPYQAPPPEPPPRAAADESAPPPIREAPVAARTTPDAPFREQVPKPAPERPFKVPAVKRFRLKNGLRVILAESPKLPLVSVEIVFKTGGGANPKEGAGLADLVADMLDEGTKSRSALQIADEIAFLGATLRTAASWDASSVSVSTLTDNIDGALAVWADVVRNPVFDDKELARVRDNLLTAIARQKDSPPVVATQTFARLLYGDDHPYGWPNHGTEASLKRLTTAELRTFYDAHYTAANAVVVAAGDITEAALRAKLEPLFAGFSGKAPPRPALPKPRAPSKTKIFLVDKAGAPQSSIRVGLVGLERRSPDYYKAMVMNHILGGGFKRLGLNLREQKGWTYGVSSVFEARRTPGPWVAGGEFVAARTAESVAELLREIRAMRDADVTDKELAETKDELVKAFPARFATVNQLAAQMATLAVYDLPDNELESFTKRISAVTKNDVRKMAQKHLQPDKLVIVVVGDQKSNEAALRTITDVELRDLEGGPVAHPAPSKGD